MRTVSAITLACRAALPLLAAISATPLRAADTDLVALRQEIAALRTDYERRLAALERRLAEIETQTVAEPPLTAAPAPAPAATGQPGTYFNPALAMIGQFLTVAGHSQVSGPPNSELRESELGLQAIIDPYARADFFLGFGEEGVELEEGFITFTALPAGLLAKVGRMRVGFGKVNSMHLDVLPWPEQPLPVVTLLGGEEGWVGSGLSVGKLLPLPGDTFSEATLQVFRGESEGLFAGERRSDLAYNGRYRVFRDLDEANNLDLGLSYARGPNGTSPDAQTRLAGLDLTYRWRPLQQAGYRRLIARAEVYRSRREQPDGTQSALGWYVSPEYRLAKRWFIGARYESSERPAEPDLRDSGGALTLTFWPSEFTQLRSELRRRRHAEGSTANELLFQLQFAMGAHGAHAF
jgi:hypothetical protein